MRAHYLCEGTRSVKVDAPGDLETGFLVPLGHQRDNTLLTGCYHADGQNPYVTTT